MNWPNLPAGNKRWDEVVFIIPLPCAEGLKELNRPLLVWWPYGRGIARAAEEERVWSSRSKRRRCRRNDESGALELPWELESGNGDVWQEVLGASRRPSCRPLQRQLWATDRLAVA